MGGTLGKQKSMPGLLDELIHEVAGFTGVPISSRESGIGPIPVFSVADEVAIENEAFTIGEVLATESVVVEGFRVGDVADRPLEATGSVPAKVERMFPTALCLDQVEKQVVRKDQPPGNVHIRIGEGMTNMEGAQSIEDSEIEHFTFGPPVLLACGTAEFEVLVFAVDDQGAVCGCPAKPAAMDAWRVPSQSGSMMFELRMPLGEKING